jgi:S1-C subfamily serine protease
VKVGCSGALVLGTEPGKAAALAGVRASIRSHSVLMLGEVITGINGLSVSNSKDVFRRMEELGVGQRVALRLASIQPETGKVVTERSVYVTLQERGTTW